MAGGAWAPTPYVRFSIVWNVAATGAAFAYPTLWPWVAAALVANHATLMAGGMAPRSSLIGPNVTRIERDDAVALTFDDGPDPVSTPRLLDLLDRRGARASFFCVGRRAERYPEIVREIVDRGHRVENHTYSHPESFAIYPPWLMRREIERAQEALARAAGTPPRWFRAPAGVRNPLLDWLLHRSRLALVSWTRRGFDTVDRDVERVSRRVTHGLRAGDILLLHDGSELGRRPAVVPIVDRVLERVERRGLSCVALPPPGSCRG